MFMQGQAPILVLSQNTKREHGRKVQLDNIRAAKTVADVIRTCLGPKSMLKMLMTPMGSMVMTNDGNAILREITVKHPAAKSMIEISRTQDEAVGDGTTSVIVLAGELLAAAQPFIEQDIHPTVIISAYRQALEDALVILRDESSIPVDLNDTKQVLNVIQTCLGTKFLGKFGSFSCELALKAVKTVMLEENGRKEIDIKRYARIEKIPGSTIESSQVLDGVILNKDVVHPKMNRLIENPRILLLDCNLEYKKGESQTDIEISKEEDFTRLLQIEEEFVKSMCDDIIKFKPDLVITEKGVSDLAQHYFVKAGISCLRRAKKTDNYRISRATGATIVNRTDEIREEDIGTRAGLFKVEKIGDEYFSYIIDCKEAKACTILLRGPSKDILNEVERNLQDAMCVARNLYMAPCVVAGGGAVEMAVGKALSERAKSLTGLQQGPYRAVARSLEVIPRTLIQNCGGDTIRTLTALRAKHAASSSSSSSPAPPAGGVEAENFRHWGINGETGTLADMKELGVLEPLAVKQQVYKTAIETSVLLLRIDDIVSGSKKRDQVEKEKRAQQVKTVAPTEESTRDD